MSHRAAFDDLVARGQWQDAHRLLYTEGRKLGQIPMLSPITFHELEGAVYSVLSWTQLQFVGMRADWRPSQYFQAVPELAGEFR